MSHIENDEDPYGAWYAMRHPSVIAGGSSNRIKVVNWWKDGDSAHGASIAGGHSNAILSDGGAIIGGAHNTIEADSAFGVILGGQSNVVHAPYALAAGRRAQAVHEGAFVWGDSTDSDVESSAANEFTVRASGGARFLTSADLSSGVTIGPGDGAWATLSDRNAKQDFEPVDPEAVLEKVAGLPLSTWSYRAQG